MDDLALALQLQAEYDQEQEAEEVAEVLPPSPTAGSAAGFGDQKSLSPVDPQWEILDPSPDVRALFLQFNQRFFWDKLDMVEVRWSPRMTLCAGLCVYEGRGGLCSVRLSAPLLKLRPRKDLIETLLHEMIHALLFVTQNNKDHDGHGPEFQKHMNRINKDIGSSISIYHNFHDEVANYRTHWWKCSGPCQKRPPYFGVVKRAMNRPPSARDTWWAQHQASCGGTYTKIKEPEGYGQKKSKAKEPKLEKPKDAPDIRSFMNGGGKAGSKEDNKGSDKSKKPAKKKGGGIQVFGGGEEEDTNSNGADNKVVPNWRPAQISTIKDFDSDDGETSRKKPETVSFSGSGMMLGNTSASSQFASGASGSATGSSSGGDNRVITRRIPGLGIITSERYVSPTKQPSETTSTITTSIRSNGDISEISRPGNSLFHTPSATITSGSQSRKRKSLAVDLDVSDSEDYLPKAKHRRSNSIEFTVDTPPGSTVSVPGFRSVCTGHSSDRRHMNSVAIDRAKSRANSKSADGKGVKGKGKAPVNSRDGVPKKRPKRITNVKDYAEDRNARVLLDSSDSDSDDEEFAPLISATRKTETKKQEQDSDPDWSMDTKKGLKAISLNTDSDNDSLILEDPRKSPMDPFDLPYKMKFPDSPVKVLQDTTNAGTGVNMDEMPGASASILNAMPADSLIDCPSCTARLLMSEINAHLDMCLA